MHPPPSGPTPVTDHQRAAITRVIGTGADPELVLAVRDARGRTFQRLEFLGDPLLELVEGLVDVVVAGAVPQHRGTTDQALSRQSGALGVHDWLEWTPSAERLADLVEAVAGAAFLTGGWRTLGSMHQRMHGPLPQEILALLEHPAAPAPPAPTPGPPVDRPHASLGATVLECAATLDVYRTFPEADEGELSALRRDRHVTLRIAAWGRDHADALRIDPRLDPALLSDAVEAWLGRLAATDGPATAVIAGARVLEQSPPLDALLKDRRRPDR
jgi:dsRNA-specific ribonuclease